MTRSDLPGRSAMLAIGADLAWSMDFMHEELSNGSKIRLLTVVAICTREALAIEVGGRLRSEDVARVWITDPKRFIGAGTNSNTGPLLGRQTIGLRFKGAKLVHTSVLKKHALLQTARRWRRRFLPALQALIRCSTRSNADEGQNWPVRS